jgi:hypothetical protein
MGNKVDASRTLNLDIGHHIGNGAQSLPSANCKNTKGRIKRHAITNIEPHASVCEYSSISTQIQRRL